MVWELQLVRFFLGTSHGKIFACGIAEQFFHKDFEQEHEGLGNLIRQKQTYDLHMILSFACLVDFTLSSQLIGRGDKASCESYQFLTHLQVPYELDVRLTPLYLFLKLHQKLDDSNMIQLYTDK
ncbi:hypothetical protein PTKIN_Ptkin11bG0010200 [Pterospermum kingtungense]